MANAPSPTMARGAIPLSACAHHFAGSAAKAKENSSRSIGTMRSRWSPPASTGSLSAQADTAIVHTHYTGTCSLIAGWFPLRFFNRIGAVEVDPDTVCNKAGHVALEMVFGDSLRGFDPRTSHAANCILIWGANPSSSAPHTDKHWLAETTAKKIVIDPIRHPTAARADLHLQLRPGTDAALAFALLHVLSQEGRIDRGISCCANRRLGRGRSAIGCLHSRLGRAGHRSPAR